jgi:hypothetical protein
MRVLMQRQFHFILLLHIIIIIIIIMVLVLGRKLLRYIHMTALGMVETIVWIYRFQCA